MKCVVLAAAFALTVGLRAVAADELDKVRGGAEADLQKALAELAAARTEVENERSPLARRLAETEQRLAERRADLAKAQRFQENQLVELNALKAESKRQGDEVKYLDSLLGEYTRAFRSRVHFAEEPRLHDLFESLEKSAVAPDLSGADRFSRRATVMSAALKRVEAALGGERFEGRTLDKQGRVQPGQIVLLGPVAVFAGEGPGNAGVLQQELNKPDPTVVPAEPAQEAQVRALVATGSGSLMFDATLGNAFKLALMHESLYEQLAKGGLIMIPMIGLGVVAILVALAKMIQLSRIRLATERDLQTVLGHLAKQEQALALQHARSIPGLAGNLLATAVEHVDEKKEYIEEILYEKMLAARAKLERGIAFLALSATTGPLMGLLGTVMGMISTFKLISSFGSGDPKALAAGISEALICTATGMAVAIPSLLLHAYLSRKARGVIGSMEQTAVGFINGIPGKEPAVFG